MAKVAFDAVQALLENTEKGRLSLIRYEKADRSPSLERLIEPKAMLEGISGLLIRALQLEPERGVRHFQTSKITSVHISPTGAICDGNCFCDGVLTLWNTSRRPGKMSSTAAPWFVEYAAHVRDAVLDLHVEDEEVDLLERIKRKLKISSDQMRAVHAYIFAEFLLGYAEDGCIDGTEDENIESLAASLEALGWRPA